MKTLFKARQKTATPFLQNKTGKKVVIPKPDNELLNEDNFNRKVRTPVYIIILLLLFVTVILGISTCVYFNLL
jgi:hypothetical protein